VQAPLLLGMLLAQFAGTSRLPAGVSMLPTLTLWQQWTP
jgi:hypothetical protein